MGSANTVLLVVEDDRDIREAFVEILETPETRVESAQDGREALQRLAKSPLPDLVLLDLMMPNVDGFGVLAEMKKSDDLRGVPVIVLSASTELRRALCAGAVAVLPKPVDLDTLLTEIGKNLPAFLA